MLACSGGSVACIIIYYISHESLYLAPSYGLSYMIFQQEFWKLQFYTDFSTFIFVNKDISLIDLEKFGLQKYYFSAITLDIYIPIFIGKHHFYH